MDNFDKDFELFAESTLLTEGAMSEMDIDPVDMLIDDITKETENIILGDKKCVTVKNNVITVKGNSFINRFSAVKMKDTVEGIILRKYGDIKPNVKITITYFKVGGRVEKDIFTKDTNKKKHAIYSVGIGGAITTSIKIKIVKAKKFKVVRAIKFMNNKDASIHYEKLSEEVLYGD